MPSKRSSRSSQPSSKTTTKTTTTTTTTTSKAKQRTKDPKPVHVSHLYTDDNPRTTLHGTGFKDGETARRTITLVSGRSLTYQWQVINTMYHRAKNHPAMRKDSNGKTEGMKDAMAIFRAWLDSTYPEAKEERKQEGREFKPLLSKELVGKYLDRINDLEPDAEKCRRFAGMYAGLAKGKRLANVLVDDARPEQEDWEVAREKALIDLTKQRKDQEGGGGEDGLWNERGGVTEWHLQCIGWAWSPVGEKRLPP